MKSLLAAAIIASVAWTTFPARGDPNAPYNPGVTTPIKKSKARNPQSERRKQIKKNEVKDKKSKEKKEVEESEIPHDFD